MCWGGGPRGSPLISRPSLIDFLLPGQTNSSGEGALSSSVEGDRTQLQSYFQVSLASPFFQSPNEEEGELVLSTLLFAEHCAGSLSLLSFFHTHHPRPNL